MSEREQIEAELAQRFHETYERLATSFGYKTRDESAVPWDDVPDTNKSLMLATVAEAMGPTLDALDHANATCSVLVGRVSILGSANRSLQARLDAANARADNAVEASHLDAADMWLAIRQRGEEKARADEAEREVERLRKVIGLPALTPEDTQ